MAKKNNEKQLTEQQERFCLEYLKDLNGKQAAIRSGYSAKTAENQASRLLSNAKVQQLVYKLNQERIKRTEIDADFVLTEHKRMAMSDVAECFDDNGNLKSITEMPKSIRLAIKSFEVYEEKDRDTGEIIGFTKKVSLWDKNKNLENLGRHLKLYTDKLEHGGNVGLADRIKKARERGKG